MALVRRYKINLSQNGYSEIVHLSQYDKDYTLILEVYIGLEKADLSGCSATLEGVRPDGLKYEFEGSISGNEASFVVDSTMTGVSGKSTGEVVFTNSGGMLYGSANFVTNIEKSAVPDGAVDADVVAAQEAAELVAGLVEDAQEAVQEAKIRYGSPLKAETVAQMTEHNRVYVYTGSEDGYTAGNWYYYDATQTPPWVPGGAYNAASVNTDSTLSVSGMPADAAAAGALRVVFTEPEEGHIVVSIGS